MNDARRKGAAFPASGGARAPDLKIVTGDAPSAGDDPPPREELLDVAKSVREMVGEVAESYVKTKKKLLKLLDEVAQCLQDSSLDDVCEDTSMEGVVDSVASLVSELVSSHGAYEEFAEDVRLGLDMTRVEFESWRAGGCRPQYGDGAAAAGTGGGRLRAALDESAEILRGVLGDHE